MVRRAVDLSVLGVEGFLGVVLLFSLGGENAFFPTCTLHPPASIHLPIAHFVNSSASKAGIGSNEPL